MKACGLATEREGEITSLFWRRTLTPKDSKASLRADPRWAVRILEAGNTPELTMPLAILSAILPAPMNPKLYVSFGMGTTPTMAAAVWRVWVWYAALERIESVNSVQFSRENGKVSLNLRILFMGSNRNRQNLDKSSEPFGFSSPKLVLF